MKTPYDIVIRPIVTEKSMALATEKKYVFQVHKTANKTEIKTAVEEIFGVKVDFVNTMQVKGKYKRQGRFEGYTSSWKKAIVKLTPASKTIQFFEGM